MSDPTDKTETDKPLGPSVTDQYLADAKFDEIVNGEKTIIAVRAQQIHAEREAARAEKDIELFEIVKGLGPDSTTEEVLAISRRVHEMKQRGPLETNKRMFVPGARFRVAKEGARIEALVFFGDTNWAGWSRNLQVGEVVELTDWRQGWNTEALVPQFHANKLPRDARWVTIAPKAGLFRSEPMMGFLEPYEEEDEA